jgi:hypothetical protein
MAGRWRDYEEAICARLRELAGSHGEITFDQRVTGRISGRERQVDILVTGDFPGIRGEPTTLACDCKSWTRRVDIQEVDRFVGFIDDVGTDLGLLVTSVGFTAGARARAAGARGIKLDVVEATSIELAFRAYCTRCDQTRVIQEPRAVTTSIGETATEGWCAVCGSTLRWNRE